MSIVYRTTPNAVRNVSGFYQSRYGFGFVLSRRLRDSVYSHHTFVRRNLFLLPSPTTFRYTAAMATPTRQDLHQAIDQLTESQLAVVASAIEHARALDQNASPPVSLRPAQAQSAFQSMLDRLARHAPNVPELRESTFSREMIYRDK
jgi:hypothetical protein